MMHGFGGLFLIFGLKKHCRIPESKIYVFSDCPENFVRVLYANDIWNNNLFSFSVVLREKMFYQLVLFKCVLQSYKKYSFIKMSSA